MAKPRALDLTKHDPAEGDAIYDLIFNDTPLREIAERIGVSYQGVYIRALAWMRLWAKEGRLDIK